MKCTSCGGELRHWETDLPFKLRESAIVIIKALPVMQCVNCPEYLIEDEVMQRVDDILARVDDGTELDVVRYAA